MIFVFRYQLKLLPRNSFEYMSGLNVQKISPTTICDIVAHRTLPKVLFETLDITMSHIGWMLYVGFRRKATSIGLAISS